MRRVRMTWWLMVVFAWVGLASPWTATRADAAGPKKLEADGSFFSFSTYNYNPGGK